MNDRKRDWFTQGPRPFNDVPRPFNLDDDGNQQWPLAALNDLMKHIKVVPDEEAEKSDYVVCMPASSPAYFDNDLFANCVRCGVRIRHRPHVPKRPPKICVDCFLIVQQEHDPDKEEKKL